MSNSIQFFSETDLPIAGNDIRLIQNFIQADNSRVTVYEQSGKVFVLGTDAAGRSSSPGSIDITPSDWALGNSISSVVDSFINLSDDGFAFLYETTTGDVNLIRFDQNFSQVFNVDIGGAVTDLGFGPNTFSITEGANGAIGVAAKTSSSAFGSNDLNFVQVGSSGLFALSVDILPAFTEATDLDISFIGGFGSGTYIVTYETAAGNLRSQVVTANGVTGNEVALSNSLTPSNFTTEYDLVNDLLYVVYDAGDLGNGVPFDERFQTRAVVLDANTIEVEVDEVLLAAGQFSVSGNFEDIGVLDDGSLVVYFSDSGLTQYNSALNEITQSFANSTFDGNLGSLSVSSDGLFLATTVTEFSSQSRIEFNTNSTTDNPNFAGSPGEVIGTGFGDNVTVGTNSDFFLGAGDDTLTGTPFTTINTAFLMRGNDTFVNDGFLVGLGAQIDGGIGTDTYDNSNSSFGHTVNLATSGISRTNPDFVDFIISFENYLGGSGEDFITGSSSRNTLVGGEGNDFINGLGDADTIEGGIGIDLLAGGLGDDTIHGGADGDSIFGEGGADTLNGDGGVDAILGGSEDDTINGGDDGDALFGQIGNDTINGDAGVDLIFGEEGSDILSGGSEDDVLFGDANNPIANEGDDTLNGDGGGDNLFAGGGDDTLFGGSGQDSLFGQDGKDILSGGADLDALVGGGGADIFVFSKEFGSDFIIDFEDDLDSIDLSGFEFADVNAALASGVAFQASNGVFFNFGNDDTLMVFGTTLQIADLVDDIII